MTGYATLGLALVSICLALALPHPSEPGRDFEDRVLHIPNTDRVLNSVLGRLQRNRHGLTVRERLSEEDYNDGLDMLPEYTESIQGPFARERGVRQLGAQKHYPICHLERKIRKLNTEEYEYRPAYYEEVRCTTTLLEDLGVTNEICSSLGFSCVQWNKTIHLTRRRYSSDCWETRTMVIPAGCECMWPVHRLGDMTLHV